MIAFPQDAPAQLLQQLPSVKDITSMVQIVFIGNIPNKNQPLEVKIRPQVVFNWLRLLKALHPLYKHIVVDDSVEMIKQMENVPYQLLSSAAHIDDPTTVGIDKTVVSDIAGVRDIDPNLMQPDIIGRVLLHCVS